jgi:hypothetical protein
VFRGVVMYLPINSTIQGFYVNYGTAAAGGSISGISLNIGNQFNGSQYGSISSLATGANTVAFSTAEVNALIATTSDIQNPTLGAQPSFLSQLVFTLEIQGTSLALTAGTFSFAVAYTQADPNIGSTTQYPYGNFD